MANSMPLISVAMATYNGEKFIAEQIESILGQTYEHIELVISDDCSQDSTRNIIETYAAKDDRIRFTFHETNLGLIGNFDSALSDCNGAFIALADQDDIWEKDKIQKLFDLITDTKALLVYSNATLIDDSGKILPYDLWDKRIRKYNLIDGNDYLPFYLNNCVTGCTTLMDAKLMEYARPLPKTTKFHDWWLAFVAARMGTIAYTNERLIRYRQHADNVTGILREKKREKKSFFKKKLEKIKKLKQEKRKLRGFFEAAYAFEKENGLDTTVSQKLLEWDRDNFRSLFLNRYKPFFKTYRRLFAMEPTDEATERKINLFLHSRKKRLYEAYLGLIAPFAAAIVLIFLFLQ